MTKSQGAMSELLREEQGGHHEGGQEDGDDATDEVDGAHQRSTALTSTVSAANSTTVSTTNTRSATGRLLDRARFIRGQHSACGPVPSSAFTRRVRSRLVLIRLVNAHACHGELGDRADAPRGTSRAWMPGTSPSSY